MPNRYIAVLDPTTLDSTNGPDYFIVDTKEKRIICKTYTPKDRSDLLKVLNA